MYSSDCVPCVDFCHRLLYILTSSRASSFSSGLQISISTDCKITDHILEISNKMWDFTEGCNSGNQTFRTIDYSYHRRFVPFVDFSYRGRFVPWIFRTLRTTDFSYHPWTFHTIAEQWREHETRRCWRQAIESPYGLMKASDRETDGRAIAYSALCISAVAR